MEEKDNKQYHQDDSDEFIQLDKNTVRKDKVENTTTSGIDQESYSNMVNNNSILLSFEGWIKYVEGFTRGLSTTKTVDASSVLDVVGEILEYMNVLRINLTKLLIYCEKTLENNEKLETEKQLLEEQVKRLTMAVPISKKEISKGKSSIVSK